MTPASSITFATSSTKSAQPVLTHSERSRSCARLAPPPAEATTPIDLHKPATKVDGRTAKNTGRSVQLNTKVRPQFFDGIDEVMRIESERLNRKVSRGYALELMLAEYQRSRGGTVKPFGLSEGALKAAELIAAQHGWDIADAKEEALTALAQERELIMRMSREEAIASLIRDRNIDGRERVIRAVADNGLMAIA